jgi:cellulose synthase/poly-beta-1,6-N-acetylglucosamine synthase-like glycosyltransferase
VTALLHPTSLVGWAVTICFAYLLATYLSYGLLVAVSVLERRVRTVSRRPGDDDLIRESPLTIPVTIVAPLFNEAPIAAAAVASFLAVDYPEFDVVVVNDGSTD